MIKLVKDKKVWVCSDSHYGHKNICRGVTEWRLPDGSIPISQTRNFNTIEQMNETIVNNINSVVGQDDVLIHLGDFSFGGFENIQKFRDRILCKEIHLVLGNHDTHIENNRDNVQ
jgi:calcineurin-like phosphoesterase family protein